MGILVPIRRINNVLYWTLNIFWLVHFSMILNVLLDSIWHICVDDTTGGSLLDIALSYELFWWFLFEWGCFLVLLGLFRDHWTVIGLWNDRGWFILLKVIRWNIGTLSEDDLLDFKELPDKSFVGFGDDSFGLDECNRGLIIPFHFPHDICTHDGSTSWNSCITVHIHISEFPWN